MAECIIGAVAAVLVAIIEALATMDRQKAKHDRDAAKAAQERAEKHAIQRAEESRLSMKIMDADIQLSIVTANAILGGHNNGNVERARKAAEEAQNEYKAFLQRITSEQITKC